MAVRLQLTLQAELCDWNRQLLLTFSGTAPKIMVSI